jgi:hypothetical protein
MRRVLIVVTAVLIVLSALPALAGHDREPTPFEEIQIQRERADRQQRRLKRNLRDMEDLAQQLPPCDVRDELLARIGRTRKLAGRMESNTERLLWVAESLVPERAYSAQAMSEQEFGRIRAALQREWWDDSRQRLLMDVARDRLFSTRQVRQVMDLFTFGDAKVNVAAALYPRVVDPQDFYTLYDALTFSSEKEELRRRIGG